MTQCEIATMITAHKVTTEEKRYKIVLHDEGDDSEYFLELNDSQIKLLEWVQKYIYGDIAFTNLEAENFERI